MADRGYQRLNALTVEELAGWLGVSFTLGCSPEDVVGDVLADIWMLDGAAEGPGEAPMERLTMTELHSWLGLVLKIGIDTTASVGDVIRAAQEVVEEIDALEGLWALEPREPDR